MDKISPEEKIQWMKKILHDFPLSSIKTKPSQSTPAALPALPKGELLTLYRKVLQKLPLSGELVRSA